MVPVDAIFHEGRLSVGGMEMKATSSATDHVCKIDLVGMRIFVAVAEARSFTGAAALLGVSKSLVSKEVTKLESALGYSVFMRTTRVVELSGQGTQLLPRVQKLLSEANDLLSIKVKNNPSQWVKDLDPELGLRQYFYRELTQALAVNDVGPSTMRLLCQKLLASNVLEEDALDEMMRQAMRAASRAPSANVTVSNLLRNKRFDRVWTVPVARSLAESLRSFLQQIKKRT